MTQEKLANALLRYDGSEAGALDELKKKISEMLDEDFKPKFTITESGRDKTDELSAGLNAKIYFDILSYASDKNGIYIIDQPEDNISQKSIREYLLERFKTMGERRQVIIVTHVKSFYEAFFADKKDYSEIEFQNSSELNKDDERIYDAIRKLITDICARLKTDLSTTNTVHQENIQSYIMSDHLGTE